MKLYLPVSEEEKTLCGEILLILCFNGIKLSVCFRTSPLSHRSGQVQEYVHVFILLLQQGLGSGALITYSTYSRDRAEYRKLGNLY